MLVSTGWLAARLGDPALVVVDMRWRESASGRELYDRGHIPGAVYLDWSTDLVDPDAAIAFMLAPPERFAAVMARCGIGRETTVVAYADRMGNGPFRLWWGSRVYGHDDVRVLDGGFDKWMAEGQPTESGPARGYPPATFKAAPRPGFFVDKRAVLAATKERGTVIVNALGPQFHKGLDPSRYGRPGRVPGSVNVPAATLVNAAGKDFTALVDAEAKFAAQGVTRDKRVICYCGGGISATIDLFLLHQLGHAALTLYDGSMGEWAKDPSLPIETD